MKIVPVIDLLNGVVVNAVKGNRAEYQPLKSVLCDSADPLAVASAFKASGFCELYVADLDAIMGTGSNASVVEKIGEETGLGVMVDAGVANLNGAQQLFDRKVSKVIVGTETLPDLSFIQEVLARFGPEKIVVSLDLRNGKVLSKSGEVASMDAFALAWEFEKMGVLELVVLDLARVGSGAGVDFSLLKRLRAYLRMRLLVGGGVRDLGDLVPLRDLGVAGVLLATALHSGQISVEQLREFEFL